MRCAFFTEKTSLKQLLGVPVPKGRKGRHQNRFYQAMTSCPVSVTST